VIARHGADRPCLIGQDGATWTTPTCLARADAVAHVLVDDLGLVPGNRVLLRGPNNPWLAACWFGVLKAGGVVVATMPLLRAGELATIHEIASLDAALVDHRFLDATAGLGLRRSCTAATHPTTSPTRHVEAHDLRRRGDVLRRRGPAGVHSGTTGRPKATMHLHRDVLAVADTFSRHVLRPTPDDVFTGTPPSRVHVRARRVLLFPAARRRVDAPGREGDAGRAADLITEHEVTICLTAPTAYKAMLAAGADPVRRCARPCPPASTCRRDAGRRFRDATGSRSSTDRVHRDAAHLHRSSGDEIRPGRRVARVPGYVARVLDEAGNRGAAGDAGRLAVKGPTGCRYLADDRSASTCSRLEHHRRHLHPATPTATSGTRRAATT
jgi:2-aminobenzoate-CoA ligase